MSRYVWYASILIMYLAGLAACWYQYDPPAPRTTPFRTTPAR